MNSYTFVPKLQNLNLQKSQQQSTILQRLQQLKQSMRPTQSLQQEYSSVPPNSNPTGQHNSAVQNQRLFQYLPRETEEKLLTKQNQEGMQEYESYRKSLEKKLNYLFEKEKHIMKTQSEYQPLKNNQLSSSQEYQMKKQIHQQQYNETFQNQPRENKFSVGGTNNPRTIDSETNDHRQCKAFSTIETNYFYNKPHLFSHKDEEIDQMQRKIKMLEMKYLGNYSQQGGSPNQVDIGHSRQGKIALSTISETAPKNNDKKSTKVKYRKEKTSPDKFKNKHHTYQKQTISNVTHNVGQKASESIGKTNKKLINSSPKKKQPIKDYMNTIENQTSEQNDNDLNEPNQLLHKQFQELKKQFHSLLEINKSMIEKVQMNEEQKCLKKEKKQKVKSMLKEILFRLDQIKHEIKNQENGHLKTISNKNLGFERVKSKSDLEVRFQKSRNNIIEKKNIERTQTKQLKSSNISNKKPKQAEKNRDTSKQDLPKSPPKGEVEKLKRLLNLEIQHRHIVEKKLEILS